MDSTGFTLRPSVQLSASGCLNKLRPSKQNWLHSPTSSRSIEAEVRIFPFPRSVPTPGAPASAQPCFSPVGLQAAPATSLLAQFQRTRSSTAIWGRAKEKSLYFQKMWASRIRFICPALRSLSPPSKKWRRGINSTAVCCPTWILTWTLTCMGGSTLPVCFS